LQDEKLRRAVMEKQESAIAQVMTQYAKLLWRVAQAVLLPAGSAQDAEECVADAFLYFWEHPDRFDPARGSLKTWLCIITRSRALDRRRQLMRQYSLRDDTAMIQKIVRTTFDHDMHHQLTSAICSLEPLDREIILRRYLYEQKPRVIALALGLSVKQVDNRLYRTKKRLRAILDERQGG